MEHDIKLQYGQGIRMYIAVFNNMSGVISRSFAKE
jgi:hypothetical protein